MKQAVAFLLLLSILLSCTQEHKQADLILTNTVIWTGNESQTYANAMAIQEGKIVYIGEAETADNFKGNDTKTIDFGKKN